MATGQSHGTLRTRSRRPLLARSAHLEHGGALVRRLDHAAPDQVDAPAVGHAVGRDAAGQHAPELAQLPAAIGQLVRAGVGALEQRCTTQQRGSGAEEGDAEGAPRALSAPALLEQDSQMHPGLFPGATTAMDVTLPVLPMTFFT